MGASSGTAVAVAGRRLARVVCRLAVFDPVLWGCVRWDLARSVFRMRPGETLPETCCARHQTECRDMKPYPVHTLLRLAVLSTLAVTIPTASSFGVVRQGSKPTKPAETTTKPPSAKPNPAPAPQTDTPPPNNGIISVNADAMTITTIKTAQNVITRVAFSREAKEAICGDLFDAASNTGSFIITKSGTDVFIKPVTTKAQTNLFIKTDSEIYNFDLVVVPATQAYRVVNVNMPAYMVQIEKRKAEAEREIAESRKQLTAEMDQKLRDRQEELDRKAADDLAEERRKLQVDVDRKANDMATRRVADGVMEGFNTVAFRERRAQIDQLDVTVGDSAFVFEGKIFIRFAVTNRGDRDVVFVQPRILVRGAEADGEREIASTTITQRGDNKSISRLTATAVTVCELPELERGQRLVFVLRFEGMERYVQLRLIESAV